MVPRTAVNFGLGELGRALVTGASDAPKAELRAALARMHGQSDALLVGSGRAGLYAILRALEPKRLVVPAYTCNAVTEAARLAGVDVAYVEIEPDGFNVSPTALARTIEKGDAFLATHQFGIPCAIDDVVRMCRDAGALVIEDCAASLGSRVGGRLTGTFGDAAFFSFDLSKLVTVPLKGGAVLAPDPALFARIRAAHESETSPMPSAVKARFLAMAGALVGVRGPRRYRAFHTLQFERKGTFTAESYDIPTARGDFYRWDMASWQAAIALRQIERIDALALRRRELYATYRERLAGARTFALPPADAAREWACIRFPIRVRGDKLAFYREAVRRGVDMAFSFTFIVAPKEFERAHALANAVLDLPFYDGLTARELDTTVRVLLAMDAERAKDRAVSGQIAC